MNTEIDRTRSRAEQLLIGLDGVVGVGEGRSHAEEPCIVVMVDLLTPELRTQIPSEVDGIAVRIEETGAIDTLGNTSYE